MTKKEPPNYHFIKIEKNCSNCENSNHVSLLGDWCEKYGRKFVSSLYICDDHEIRKTEKKFYSIVPSGLNVEIEK